MPPHRTPTPQDIESHDCVSDRRITHLELEQRNMNARLHDGDLVMQRLDISLKTLNDTVARLAVVVEAFKTPNSFGQQVLSSAINFGVPALIMGVLWVLIKSGAIALKGIQ